MTGWEAISKDQDGFSLIKLLHKVHFDIDESKQSIQEIVTAHKKLFLCFQKKDWSLDKYIREFTVRQEKEVHQDLEEGGDLNFVFIQNKSGTNKIVTEQHARETLKPSFIYLDITSSFHQMFCNK